MENNPQGSEKEATQVLQGWGFSSEMICTKECSRIIAEDSSQTHHMDIQGINSKTNMAISRQDHTRTSTETAIKNIEKLKIRA